MLSDEIQYFLNNLLEEEGGSILIKRSDIAVRFNCSPSQINYVLTTRFAPHFGYYIQSRRGEGGYIKIDKLDLLEDEDAYKEILMEAIGDSITIKEAHDIITKLCDDEIITKDEKEIILASIDDRALAIDIDKRNALRSDILKNILLVLLKRG